MTTQSTDWCLTYNCQDEVEAMRAWTSIVDGVANSGKFLYCRMQFERGTEGGNLHIQGFFILKSRSRWSTVNRWLDIEGGHWETRKGSREQAAAYCKKEETRVKNLEGFEGIKTEWEWGEIPKKLSLTKMSGRDTLLEAVREEIDSGGKVEAEKLPACILFDQVYEKMVSYAANNTSYLEMKNRMRKALVLHGDAGVGKSYSAVKIAEEIFGIPKVLKITVTSRDRLWFPDLRYKPEAEILIIDEFQWGTVVADQFKALLSGDAPMVEIKGGFRPNTFKQIIITTNDDPRIWGVKPKKDALSGQWVRDADDEALRWDDHYKAVQRRFEAFNCNDLGKDLTVAHAKIESWLREKLSWGLSIEEAEKEEEDRLVGEGAASQRMGVVYDVDEEEGDPGSSQEPWTPNLEEDGRLHRCDATSNLLGDDDEEN